jgi:peptidyl-prolyl cis-trans isomerase B (cyclophilin B)
VASFSFLAQEGFFDGTPCHRLTTSGIYVLQCGDPTGTGTGGPGYSIPLENAPADETYPAGTLAMARSAEPDSGGSQFFVVYEDTRLPAPGYTVFGRVTSGLDLLEDLAAAGADDANGPGDGAPNQEIGIAGVSVA